MGSDAAPPHHNDYHFCRVYATLVLTATPNREKLRSVSRSTWQNDNRVSDYIDYHLRNLPAGSDRRVDDGTQIAGHIQGSGASATWKTWQPILTASLSRKGQAAAEGRLTHGALALLGVFANDPEISIMVNKAHIELLPQLEHS